MILVVDVVKEIVAKVSDRLTAQLQTVNPQITGVHCLVGHHTEINNRLQGLAKTTTKRFDRYPLIALFQDFEETRGDGTGFYGTVDLQLIILYHTSASDYTEDRYEKVFKPILYPIYHAFLEETKAHKYVSVMSLSKLYHKKIDRPHWGNPDMYGNDGYIFNDVLDGIELRYQNLTLAIPANCQRGGTQLINTY